MMSLLFSMLLCIGVAAPPSVVPCQQRKPCEEHPQLADECFTVRGRMNFANGTPSVRIWVAGTHRILGVSESRFADPSYCNLPDDILEKLSWDSDLFGDFMVCPFTKDEPGVMRLVCVQSVGNASVRGPELK